MAKKKKPKAKARSEIIEQCLIYAQALAAYNAGFCVDPTGDFDYAGCGAGQLGRHHFRNAKRALEKLVTLGEDVPAISRDELFAKARVTRLLQMTDAGRNPEKHEAEYIKRFAKDVSQYLQLQDDGADRSGSATASG